MSHLSMDRFALVPAQKAEAERTWQTKYEELLAQFNEAEDIIVDIRAKLEKTEKAHDRLVENLIEQKKAYSQSEEKANSRMQCLIDYIVELVEESQLLQEQIKKQAAKNELFKEHIAKLEAYERKGKRLQCTFCEK